MTRLAKAMSAFTFGRSASAAGRNDGRSLAIRAGSRSADGSGAPSSTCAQATPDRTYRASLALVALFASALLFLVLATGAFAGKRVDHIVAGSASSGTTGGLFNTPRGVAVNSTGQGDADAGDVYVVDGANNRISQFDADDNFIRSFGQDVLGINEQQRVTVNATGGTYRLTFDGETTGATGSGDLSGTAGTGDIALASGNGLVRTGDPIITGVTNIASFAVGMRITATGLPAGTRITAVNAGAGTVTISANPTSGGAGGTNRALTAGGIQNAAGGSFAVGQTIVGAGIPNNTTILAVDGATITPSNVPTTAATGVALTAGSTTVANLASITGIFVVGQAISGPGIAADTTITACAPNCAAPTALTLSAPPGASANGAALASAIPFNASSSVLDNLLDILPSINGDANVDVSGSQVAGYVATFQAALAGTDVDQMSADAAGLSGGASTATVQTLQDGVGGPFTGFEKCEVAAHCKAGITSAPTGGSMNAPQGIAIDQSDGSLYVTDQGNRRVQKFSAGGDFDRAWGWDVVTGGVTTFEVCTSISDCKIAATAGGGAGQFAATLGRLAVAPNDNVFVADATNRRVQEFEPDGDWVRAFGWDVVQPGGAGEQTAVADEFQTVTISRGATGTITGGGFTLTFDGQTTDPITYLDATAADVQAALEGLSNLDTNDVSVTGGPGAASGATFTVQFTGALAGDDVPQMTINGSGLTHSVSPILITASVATSVQGGTIVPGFEICTVATQCKAGANSVPADAAGAFATTNPVHLAIDSGGTLYASDSTAGNRIQRFDTGETTAAALLMSPLDVAAVTASPSATTTGLATTATDNLLVARSAALGVLEIGDPDGTPAEADRHYQNSNLAANAIALDTASGDLYMTSQTGGHRLFVADNNGAPPPIVTIQPPTAVTDNSATLHALINPGAIGIPVSYRFQTSTDGVIWRDVHANVDLGDGLAEIPAQQPATGLLPNTLYHVRVLTSKGFGAAVDVPSATAIFTTNPIPPQLTALATAAVDDTGARLQARVKPNGSPTAYRFEYLTAADFAANGSSFSGPNAPTRIPVPDAPIGAGHDWVFVAQQLSGLVPDTAFRFRVLADNGVGVPVASADRTFTTRATPAPSDERAYELVSPPYKLSGVGVGSWGSDLTTSDKVGNPANDAERFAVKGDVGSRLVDGGFSFGSDIALAERVSDTAGWRSHSPYVRGGYGSQIYRVASMFVANDDLSLMGWTSAGALRLFPEMESWPDEGAGFLSDWGSPPVSPTRWELFAVTDVAQKPSGVSADPIDVNTASISDDGRYAVIAGLLRGLAGAGDPTHQDWPEGFSSGTGGFEGLPTHSAYMIDLSDGLTDAFPAPDDTRRKLINVCTGDTGEGDRTLIPARLASGKQSAQACPDALSGRDDALISSRGGNLMLGASADRSISEDGSRIFFMAPDPLAGDNDGSGPLSHGSSPCSTHAAAIDDGTSCPAQVYVRQRNPGGDIAVRWLSRTAVSAANGASADQDASLMGRALLESAARDGSRVLFRTDSPLTADDPNGAGSTPPAGGVTAGSASPQSWDLYSYELGDGADPAAGGELTRVSAGPNGDGDCNVPAGTAIPGGLGATEGQSVRYTSEDATRAYFTCEEPLAGVGAPANGTITSPGSGAEALNLYYYELAPGGAESWRFVARLPRTSPLGDCATLGASSGGTLNVAVGGDATRIREGSNCVKGSSDGSLISFFTDGRLTADDPDAASGDVYAYDALADELVRASAPQGGVGGAYACGSQLCYGDSLIASGTPTEILAVSGGASDPGGRAVFFESRSRLVPGDGNDLYDVYQWRGGELSLITPALPSLEGGEDITYLGVSRDGRNVYFATTQRLTWQDTDAVRDVYTARLGGGIPEPPSPPLCAVLADACQDAPAAAPAPSGAGTAFFDAGRSGNFVPRPIRGGRKPRRRCARGKVRRGGRCVAKKKGAKKRAKRANADRRASR